MNEVKTYIGQTTAPATEHEGSCAMQTYSWANGNMSENSVHEVGNNGTPKRMYLNFNMPVLPGNPRIKRAELKFNVTAINKPADYAPAIGLFRVTEEIEVGAVTPAFNANPVDYAILQAVGEYAFDVTSLVDVAYSEQNNNQNVVLMLLNESQSASVSATICGASSEAAPVLAFTYETTFGVNTCGRIHTHELGRFGQGSIDLVSGNLMFESTDFAWGGNRMPVNLKHLYTSALSNYRYTGNDTIKLRAADFTAMDLGRGWKLNVMQSMVATTFLHEGASCNGYVYVGENGDETYFKLSEQTKTGEDGSAYNLYETIDESELFYDPVERTLDFGGHIHLFDAAGRLIKITDQHGNFMGITYTNGKITSVCDGAGREFVFNYTGALLTSITAPDNTVVNYAYSNGVLVGITYPENGQTAISYDSENLPELVTVKDAEGNDVYVVHYMFYRRKIEMIEEYGMEKTADEDGNIVITPVPGKLTCYGFSIASRKTAMKSGLVSGTLFSVSEEVFDDYDNPCTTSYTYDEDGNIISEYIYGFTSTSGVNGNGAGIDPYFANGVSAVNLSNNLLANHAFNGLNTWTQNNELNYEVITDETQVRYGKNVVKMSTDAVVIGKGLSQVVAAPKGDLTFSAYLRMPENITTGQNPGMYLRILDASGNIITETEHVSASNGKYFRLDVPFTLNAVQNITVQILMNGSGSVYVNAPQLETNGCTSVYNMLQNGHFDPNRTSEWTRSNGAELSTTAMFGMTGSMKVNGDLNAANGVSQNVAVHTARTTRETFMLSGWAKGSGIADRERAGLENAKFTLKATAHYVESANQEPDVFEAPFNTAINDWQYMTLQFAKTKFAEVDHVEVSCNYDYSFGTVYFDDIQLVREYLETGLTAEDFADVEEQTVEPEEEGDVFEEVYDGFGNALTETIFSDNEADGTLYRAFQYQNGNDLIAEMDNRGYITHYGVRADNSQVFAIGDRCDTVFEYERDDAGRIIQIRNVNPGNNSPSVSYTYDEFDNLSKIVRGDGMQYVLQYNQFHNLDAICVAEGGHAIVQYAYKDGNGRLKQVTYANGDVMKVAYNYLGQMIAERWYNVDDELTAYYRYSYDNNGNIVRSIDILAQKEYSYTYEEGRLMRAVECDVTLNENIVTARTQVNTILYTYDAEGTLTWKRIIPAVGAEAVLRYGSNSNGRTTVQCSGNDFDFVSLSQTDSLGRKKLDELHIGNTVLARQFTYHEGSITPEHETHNKIKYAPTTQLVKTITLPDRTLTYFYDPEERITKVIDSLEGTTEYIYDYLGQLRRETHDGTVVNEMEYDKYGNITRKNRMPYAYDIDAWKDLMTYFAGQRIDYDGVGNPVLYCGKGMVWEKGRQLKEIVGENCNIGYTYNANGIRTSKTVNGVKHTYTLDGTKILREAWGNNELIPLYDVEDAPCGIVYNGTPYYFLKNLQGDIIAIVNENRETVARYRYDAWGVCTIISDTSNCNIATINPFRYRGYYYDEEIAMYYLQSRYYDPMVGRFINGDDISALGVATQVVDYNLFSYCRNTPVNNHDASGSISWSTITSFFNKLLSGISKVIDIVKKFVSKQLKNYEDTLGSWQNVSAIAKEIGRSPLKVKQSLTSLIDKLTKLKNRLGKIATGITILSTIAMLGEKLVRLGNITAVMAECIMETMISAFEEVLTSSLKDLLRLIPAVGIILGLFAGSIVSAILDAVLKPARLQNVRQKIQSAIEVTAYSLKDYFIVFFKNIA